MNSQQLRIKVHGRFRYTQRDALRIRRAVRATGRDDGRVMGGSPSIGAEYGEGFQVYSAAMHLSHFDVAALNKQLRITGAQRLRHAMKPDEALGAIFVLEDVLVDTQQIRELAWKLLAAENSLPVPMAMGRQIFDLSPMKVITDVLQWSRDVGSARTLAERLGQLYTDLFRDLDEPQSGAIDWLRVLKKTKVPCAVISQMRREDVRNVLCKMGLEAFFAADVAFEDDMETLAQQYLCAAMKLERPPDHCIVFDCSPAGIAAAHNCTMKVVAVQGSFKGYQLKQADLTCASLDELTVYNLRRLFANRGSEFMDHMKGKGTKKENRDNTIATF